MRPTLKLAACAAAAVSLAGCLSPELTQRTLGAHRDAQALADAQRGMLNRTIDNKRAFIEQAQEVNRPYLVGRSIPLSKDVALPRALQKGVRTATLFPDTRVSLAQAAQRITLVTGITVSITPDVYLPAISLMPKSGTVTAPAAATPAAAAVPLPTPIAAAGATVGSLPPAPMPISVAQASGVGPVQPDSPLELDFPRMEAPLSQILDSIANRLQIKWKYDEQANAIKFYRLVTKSWNIPVSPATNSYSTSFSGPTYQSNNSNALTAQQAASTVRSEASGLNELNSIKEAADTVLTRAGTINASQATGTITITDTADAIERADAIITEQVAILSRMVLLRVQTVQITTTDTGESGVDWNAVLTKALEHVPAFSLTALSPATLVSGNAGTLGLNLLSGSGSGTQAIIRALAEIGRVQTSTELPLSTRNRHAISYNVRNTFSYVSSTTPGVSSVAGTASTPGIQTAQDSTGLKLVLFPNATSKDTVMLTLSIDQSVLQSLQTFVSGSGTAQQSVQLPNVNGEGSTQEVPIRNGQTLILTGFDRLNSQYDRRTMGDGLPLALGGSNTQSRTRTTTIVLVSAVIRDDKDS
ncbi:hypothetical protein BKK79_36730 (plasmid) [Cupriavidus sp. USMAA2-4]|uniref:hypothetical protein n=1 Tax=Cupriavidus sp. USMAA2-4 TaxID=876364 RepID=UPI0008A6CEDE|nr:hypothetical protein [Cupriavidus sp. USMAA2-4]AOY97496.1 hypothetical protein BKK79_36730 [Cupriavidus sp. USMAA2-4]